MDRKHNSKSKRRELKKTRAGKRVDKNRGFEGNMEMKRMEMIKSKKKHIKMERGNIPLLCELEKKTNKKNEKKQGIKKKNEKKQRQTSRIH